MEFLVKKKNGTAEKKVGPIFVVVEDSTYSLSHLFISKAGEDVVGGIESRRCPYKVDTLGPGRRGVLSVP